jgi:ketosteroid isomerase-like protein
MTNTAHTNAGPTVERIIAAFNAKDMNQYLALQQPQIEILAPGGISLRGRDQVQQHIGAQWTAFPDATMTIIDQFATETHAATEIELSGTHTGPLPTPGGPLPATGKRIAVRFAAVHHVRDGMATSEHVYLDQVEMMTQLGLLPSS